MPRRIFLLLLLGVVAAASRAQTLTPPFDIKAPAVIEQGRVIFNLRCAGRCHGIDGRDGFDAPILAGKDYLDPPFILGTLLAGRPGSAMPSWKGRLTDEELWRVVAFLSSLGDQARAAQSR
jgi:mono/diheme cytochrome c family protein